MNTAQRNNGTQKGQQQKTGKRPARKGRDVQSNKQKQGGVKQIAAAYSRPQTTQRLKQGIRSDGARTLKWREFVQDIPGSVAFSSTTFPVQPGVPTLFAWLASQASLYQEYEFMNLRFIYETEKGSSTNGKVMFAFQPDVYDEPPANKQEMLENMYKATGAPWESFNLPVPRSALKTLGQSKYVRTATIIGGDLKTYDVGQLIVATQGMADASSVGELYVEYEILLKTPVQSTRAAIYSVSADITSAGGNVGAYMGVSPVVIGGLDITASNNTITWNRVGSYIMTTFIVGTGLTEEIEPTHTGTAGVVTLFGTANTASNTGTFGEVVHKITVNQRGLTTIFNFDPAVTTLTSSHVYIAAFYIN